MATKPLHAQHQHIKRGDGRNACASAAYRSGDAIHDLRTGQTFDYTRKQRVDENILVGWQGTNTELWQAVELAEKRTDAKLADEHEVSLPNCMSIEHRRQLAVKIAEVISSDYGKDHKSGQAPVCASIHNLYKPEPEEKRFDNPHVHIMIATRAADPTTETGLDAEKLPVHWSKAKRDKNGLEFENQSARCSRLRELIADTINSELERLGYEDRVDHRSYADQGINKIPQKHLGAAATALERRGIKTDRGDYNRTVVEANKTAEIIDILKFKLEQREAAKADLFEQPREKLQNKFALATDFDFVREQSPRYFTAKREHQEAKREISYAKFEATEANKAVKQFEQQHPFRTYLVNTGLLKPNPEHAALLQQQAIAKQQLEVAEAAEKSALAAGRAVVAELKKDFEKSEPRRKAEAGLIREVLADPAYVEKEDKCDEARSERLERERAEREAKHAEFKQAQIDRYGYDPMQETRDQFLRRQAKEQERSHQQPTPTRRSIQRGGFDMEM
ncbi:MobA/MobL family protein [Marinospirillum sp.]|uniref:MobA/MobL family protein n=1 Tax=Marinospirillum sp. TaxID=2183934 RepID=UPI003A8998CC